MDGQYLTLLQILIELSYFYDHDAIDAVSVSDISPTQDPFILKKKSFGLITSVVILEQTIHLLECRDLIRLYSYIVIVYTMLTHN
jgi:hypothetical protein